MPPSLPRSSFEERKKGTLQLIVSGGQTGAALAPLDWAIEHGIQYGNWPP